MSDLESEGYEEDGGPYLGVSLTIWKLVIKAKH